MTDPDLPLPARFVLRADPSPGLLPRILAPFAKRDLVPERFEARRDGEVMRIEITLPAMPAGMVHLVAGNIAQIVGVLDLRHEDETRRAA